MPRYRPKDPLVWRLIDRVGNGPIGGPVGCLILLLYSVLALPLLPLFLVVVAQRGAYFRRTLRRQRRVLSWAELLERARAGAPGSVIIEVGNKRGTRFWWTDDRLLSLAPVPPPAFEELNIISYGGANQHPFIEWCYDRYLSLETGSALHVEEEADFETFPFEDDYAVRMKERFPRQDVVVVTFYDTRY